MLILSRKIGEEVVIGSDVRVVILGATENYVKIGIEAPQDVPIMRAELLAPPADHPPGMSR